MACKDVGMSADYDVVGINACMNANRVSWFFDLHGTSMNIDTACSSSLVAMDLACQGLQSGDADMGIVAGTNMILSPDMMQVFSNVNMLSSDSRSHSFDHRANGYGRGEETGTLILKRLRDAIRDGDTIQAVVRATGSNQDGLTPSGIMQPSGASQAQLIRKPTRKQGLVWSQPVSSRLMEQELRSVIQLSATQ
jgi:acyl transferase domain-containing protein